MKTPSILIVDDESHLVRLYQEMLIYFWPECQVMTSSSGKEALFLIETNAIDILVTDIRMPDMDGLTLMRKAQTLQPDIQLLVMTALGETESAVEALKIGASNYLIKPVKGEVLYLAINNAWAKKMAIEEHRQSETSLRESEAGYRAMFEHMNDGVAVYEAVNDGNEFVFADFNRAAENIDQISKEAVIGRRLTELFPGSQEMGLIDIMRQVWRTGKAEYMMATLYRDNRISGWRDNYIYKLPNGRIVSIFRDQTERIQAQEAYEQLLKQLHQAQKLESIGALAGGIAHDFNNILFPIIGFAEMTLEELPTESHLRDNMESILKASFRARDLIQQILNFSRQTADDHQSITIHSIITETIQLLSATLPKTITIQNKINISGPIIANTDQIHQVIMNLCTNAYHAMAENGGVLTVTLKEVMMETIEPLLYPNLPPGEYVQLTVADTGHGMAPAVVERIFDPYFTTKDKTKGSGLGLSVVHGIVKSINGHIRVSSEPGRGSSFHIFFPLLGKTTAETVKAPENNICGGHERILVVDDEKPILKMLENMLSYSGYQVTACESSLEALELFWHQPEAFDLVIADVTMPNMTGIEFSRKILEIRPATPIIICTGFSELITAESAKKMGIRHLIMKPIVRGEITRIIRRILDQERS